jgi:hypothetical protein
MITVHYGDDAMRKTISVTAVALLAWLVWSVWVAPAAAQSGEFVETTVALFGYAVNLPREFTQKDAASDTTAWTYRPDPADEKGGALTIWVNRVLLQTKDLAALYEISRKYDADSVDAPGAGIRDLRDLAVEGGYGYWYKEAHKSEPAANHRWIAKVFGNGAVYTICVAGPFGEFEAWGPVFERVIVSFRLVSTKAE